jgi:hypothetical protein
VLLVVVPLVVGRAEGWPAWTWLSLAASAPAFAGFVAAERRVRTRGGTPLVSLDALAPRAVSSGMLAVAAATSTYYGLLFTLALYLQQGLGRSALESGLTLVSWVAAFGAAGQIVRRLPPRLGPLAAPAGCLLLAGAYVALSASLFAGRHPEALLVVLLGAGGLGLGTQFSALIVHLTNAVSDGYAPRHQRRHHHHDDDRGRHRDRRLRHGLPEPGLGGLRHARLRDRDCGLRGHRRARRAAGPRRHPAGDRQLTSRPARRPRARRRSAKVTRMPSSETASVILDSPAMRSLKTKGTSSMRLPIR